MQTVSGDNSEKAKLELMAYNYTKAEAIDRIAQLDLLAKENQRLASQRGKHPTYVKWRKELMRNQLAEIKDLKERFNIK